MPTQIISGDVRVDPYELRPVLKKHGITRIDTAARYQNGESEKIIGAARLPEDFTIDTKINVTSPAAGSLTPEAVEKSLTHSLSVLGVDKVNVLYCHAPDPETPIHVQAKAFDDQHRKGRFAYLGVSNFGTAMVQEWLDVAEKEGFIKPTVFQGQYNLLCRTYEESLFPLLRKNGISFAAFSPLAGGFLLGNFTAEGVQSGHRFSVESPFKEWYDHASMHEAVQKLKSISARTGLGMDELSLRWLRHHSILNNGDAIILGASKISQVEPSCQKAAKGPLEQETAAELSALWAGVAGDAEAIVEY